MSDSFNFEMVVATIANGQSLSDVIVVGRRTPLWIDTPAGLAGTVITFVSVLDNDTELVMRDSAGAELSLTIGTAGSRHMLLPTLGVSLAGVRRMKLRAGTLGSPSPQTGAQALSLGLRTVV